MRHVRGLALLFSLVGLPVALALSIPSLALAQETADASSSSTPAGQLYTYVALAVLGLLALLVGLVGRFLAVKGKDSKLWGAVNAVWTIVQVAVSHAEVELRPEIQKALADGTLTPAEAAVLKAKVVEIVRREAGAALAELQRLLEMSAPGVQLFVSGLIERAVAALKLSPLPVDLAKLAQASAPASAETTKAMQAAVARVDELRSRNTPGARPRPPATSAPSSGEKIP